MLVRFEQNRMMRNIQKFELFGKKWFTIYEKESTPLTFRCKNINLKTVIFPFSKIYGNPTRVTRLDFAPNMAIPIILDEKELYP